MQKDTSSKGELAKISFTLRYLLFVLQLLISQGPALGMLLSLGGSPVDQPISVSPAPHTSSCRYEPNATACLELEISRCVSSECP